MYETVSGYSDAGHAYVFNAKTGALISTLTSPNAQTGGYFGISVGVSGNTVVAGAYGETASGYLGAGHAYIFNAKTGALINTLTSPNAQTDGHFGTSVAVSGSTVVVAAVRETALGYSNAGRAYIFSATTGALISTLTSPNAQTDGYFGTSVAASGSTVVVGAMYETVSGYSDAGHAYIFNAKTGALISTLTSPNAQTDGYFPTSVGVSGNTVVAGAMYETVSGYSAAGRAYIFSETTGALIRTLTSPNAQTYGYFGTSVAASGSTVVVGANDETASGYPFAGHAYIFNAKTGALISTLTSPNAQTDGHFGTSVAASGSTVVVGAGDETASGYSEAGHAYSFVFSFSEMTSPSPQSNGWFGEFVAVSGSLVVVGAPGETASGYGGAGHAYIINTTSGSVTTLTSPNAQTGGWFGLSVAISGTTIVVGAPRESVSGLVDAGRVYTFNATTGALMKTLTSPNAQPDGNFGWWVAISGTTMVVGAYGEAVSGYSYAGHAYTFNSETGALMKTLSSPNAQYFGLFGSSVAISGTTVVIGALNETASGYAYAGHAYTFSAKTGKLISTLTSPNAQSYGWFGESVAISGPIVVVGALNETVSGYSNAGRAYSFVSTTGTLIMTLTSPDAQTGGMFGIDVAVSGTTIVVGAQGENVSGYSNAGHAYVFSSSTGSLIETFTSPNAQSGGLFGTFVAMSGTTIAVGAYGENSSGYSEAGHAYIF